MRVLSVTCSKCGAPVGQRCIGKDGSRLDDPHRQRVRLFYEIFDHGQAVCRSREPWGAHWGAGR